MQSCAVLLVDQIRVFLEGLRSFLPHRVLHFADGLGVEQMIFAAHAIGVTAAHRKLRIGFGSGWNASSCFIAASRARTSSPTPSMRDAVPVKYFSTSVLVQPDGFEHLRAAITLQRRDAHLREDLQQTLC